MHQKNNKISISRCEEYDIEKIKAIVEKTFLDLGLENEIKSGETVVIKPNLVMGKNPDEAATTHPYLVWAIAEYVKNCGAKAIIAESPGGPYTTQLLKKIYHTCGMDLAAENSGAELNFNLKYEEVRYSEIRSFYIIEPILKADKVISVSKLKTHGMTKMTGATKNMFGAIPGLFKAEYHYRLPERKDFCEMLVDLCECTAPTISFVDAIDGMEGDGPTAGSKRHIGAILASENPHALDLVGSLIMSVDPETVHTIKIAQEKKLCPKSADEIKIIGEDYKNFIISDFKQSDGASLDFSHKLPKFVVGIAKKLLNPKPRFDYSMCVGCGECKRLCPPQVIEMVNNRPIVKLDECIRCFCCAELCPKKAVTIKRSFIMKILQKSK